MRRYGSMLIALMLLVPALALGTGKIKGKVVDRESGEPLVGANVSVVGTPSGAATDVNGEYTILNVPIGLQNIRATYVGYSPTTINGIRVNNDLTTEANFRLSTEAVALQAVEVVAERPLVNKSATNAVRITTGEDIANLPVRGVNNVIAQSAGVVLQDNTIFVRGGRQDEVGFYMEGMSITNPMLGGQAVTLVQDAVEEIQLQAGGYNAEFGGANSGIVQTQLRTGTSIYKASLEYVTDNVGLQGKSDIHSGTSRLGAYWFGYNELTATASGPVLDEHFKLFGLFNYNYTRDQNPQPFPGITVGMVRDPVSGDSLDLQYPAGPVLRNSLEQYTYTGTFTMDLRPFTVRFSGTYTKGQSFNPWTSRWPGSVTNLMNTDRVQINDNWNGAGSVKFTHFLNPTTFYELTGGYFYQAIRGRDPALEDDFLSYGDSVANAEAGYVWQRGPGDPTGRFIRPSTIQIFDFAFTPYGFPIAGFNYVRRTNFALGGSFFTQLGVHSLKIGGEYQRYTIRQFQLSNEAAFAIAGLVDQNNRLPEGDPGKQTLEEIMINRGVNNIGFDPLFNEIESEGYQGARHPVFGGAYVQDKIEWSDLVVNVGLRFDYIDVANYAFIDPGHPELSIDKDNGRVYESGIRKTNSFSAVSPRVGLGFPVSDKTVFHAQFGKFIQQSRLADVYNGLYATGANLRGGFFIPAPVGFDVRPTRTTQYEIGFTQQIGDGASFDITGFYKDIKDQIVYDQVYTSTGSPYGAYATLVNGDFATTKGIEIKFTMRRLKRLQANASLAFQDAQGTGSFPNSNRGIVGAPLDGVTIFRPQYISPLEYNNAFRGNLNLDYRWDKDDGGPILEQLGVSALLSVNSGHPFTRGRGGSDLENDARDRQPIEPLGSSTTPWNVQVDLRIDKTVTIADLVDLNLYLFVINLFDARNIQNLFLRTGSATDDGYLSNPSLGGQLIRTFGPIYEQVYRAVNIDYYERWRNAMTGAAITTNPFFYGPPRQIRFGLRLEL